METFYFTSSSIVPVRKEPSETSEMVTQLLFGDLVIGGLTEGNWLSIITIVDQYPGWVDEKMLSAIPVLPKDLDPVWFVGDPFLPARVEVPEGGNFTLRLSLGSSLPGLFTEESQGKLLSFPLKGQTIKVPRQGLIKKRNSQGNEIVEAGRLFLGTPYLWGGRSFWGMDCSGLTQMAFRLCGLNLPRDASQQEKLGQIVTFDEKQPGDLAFFSGESGKVNHVGIVSSAGMVLHASGRVREDKLLKEGIFNFQNSNFSHQLFNLKRYI